MSPDAEEVAHSHGKAAEHEVHDAVYTFGVTVPHEVEQENEKKSD